MASAEISPSASNTSQDQPLSFSSSFQLDGSFPLTSVNANAAAAADAGQDMRPRNLSSTEYSQKQLMGKFSVHDGTMNAQQQNADQVPGEYMLSPRPSHALDMGMEPSVDVDCNFMQPQAFDIDFLPNETDMISDYLMGVFPQMDYQDAMMHDLSDSYGGGTDSLTGAARSSNHADSPALVQSTGPSNQSQAFVDEPRAIETERDGINATRRVSTKTGGSLDAIDDIVPTNPWAISSAAYEKLTLIVSMHEHVLPKPFTLPSRQRLSTFVASWIRGFHPHLPFIHLPTTNLDSMSPMLLLTLAATGSFYGFEHTYGYAMYFIAKSVINEELEERRRLSTLQMLQAFPPYAELRTNSSQRPASHYSASSTPVDTELLQALLVLVLTMSWLDGPLAQDALAISSQLTALTREALRDQPAETIKHNWVDWAREEERRRTILSAYFVLNIQTICFNVPPQITNSEINLALPCSEAEFKAPNSESWRHLQQKHRLLQPQFQHCLKQILSGKPLANQESVTEFGNYMLVQSLLMHIYFERQAASGLLDSPSNFSTDTITLYDTALGAWQSCWDTAIESALDPSTSPHGPLAFNSTAILRLAHIHLGAAVQSQTALLTRDPRMIAQAFEPQQNLIPLRSSHLDQAVLHAICALRIPVRVGIAFVARGRTGHWSVQHAISNFACALLLTHWLENIFCLVSSDGLDALRSEEKRLLSTIDRLIEETHLEGSLGPKDRYPSRIRRLAVAAVKLWAETCTGIQVFEIVHVIGETLSLVAESIEGRL